MKKIGLLLCLLLATNLLFCQTKLIDLEGVFQGKYRYDRIASLSWRPNSSQYSYYNAEKDAVMVVDVRKGKETQVLKMDRIYEEFGKSIGQPMTKEIFKEKWGYLSTSYHWDDENTLRFSIVWNDKQMYAVYNVKNQQFSCRAYGDGSFDIVDEAGYNSVYIYTRNDKGVYYVNDFRNPCQKDLILCSDTAKDVVFGEPVHRSEWGIDEGWYFSPNSNYIAFYRMDQSMVEDYPLLQTSAGREAADIAYVKNIKYPMAGRKSHEVKVGIFDVRKSLTEQKSEWYYVKTDLEDGEFLTNVTFSPDEKYLYITHLNREQNHSKLIQYEVTSGKKVAVLIEEEDGRYVEPQHRMIFLKNGRFLWQSDRDGWNHFYLYEANGQMVKQVTSGSWPVLEELGLSPDEKYVYFMTNKDNPVDRYLYRADIETGELNCLTADRGTHTVVMSSDKKYFFDYFSDLHTPLQIRVCGTDGKFQKLLKESKSPYDGYELGRDTIFSLKSVSGEDLYCEMIFPPHFDKSKKYPCLVYVYGGPHSQLVTNTYMTAGVFLNYMAQKGYVIFVMDNRGTSNRGAEFEKCIHRRLGVCESEDQMVGVEYLRSLPFIDASRMGIDGWSFGGFMTLTMVTEHPDVFSSATCGGPVVNWEWYEIMYGERYMDTPKENPEGYEHANIIPKIKNLSCPLLIMHGQQDNTVVQQHSLELLHRSVLDDVQIHYFPYTTHEHNVMGTDRVQMWHKIEQFHDKNLMK